MVFRLIQVLALTAAVIVHAVDPMSYANNFYILTSTSHYYKNYRHSVDTMKIYRYLRDMGINDN